MYATLIGPFAGAALVMVGGVPITMEKLCVDAGAVPFDAVTMPLNVPTALGVPEITPDALKLRPVGNAPVVTA